MREYVYFGLIAPSCESCGRKESEEAQIRVETSAGEMLREAGFGAWSVWMERTPLNVAAEFERIVKVLNADASKYAALTETWAIYGSTMWNMEEFAKACRKVPNGIVKVMVPGR